MEYTVHGILQARILEWVAFPFSRGLPNPGIKPRSHALQVDSLPAKPQGKPKKTGVGSLSLLQGIFPTQEPNQGLLHCRQILYQLSYRGSPGLLPKDTANPLWKTAVPRHMDTYIWTCAEYELSTTNWHLPSTFTRLIHVLLQLLIFNILEEVQGAEQKWPTRCSGKNCQNRSSDSY